MSWVFGVLLVTLAISGRRESLGASRLLARESFDASVGVDVSIALILGGEALRAKGTFELLFVDALDLAGQPRLHRRDDGFADYGAFRDDRVGGRVGTVGGRAETIFARGRWA